MLDDISEVEEIEILKRILIESKTTDEIFVLNKEQAKAILDFLIDAENALLNGDWH
jgi:hypothetical protein